MAKKKSNNEPSVLPNCYLEEKIVRRVLINFLIKDVGLERLSSDTINLFIERCKIEQGINK